MTDENTAQSRRVPALRMKQWLSLWDSYNFSAEEHRRRPDEHLFMFSMRAADLRHLCDVYRRTRDGSNVEGIQRVRDPSRTGRIQRYVRYGYPYGDLGEPQRTVEALALRKPGWLPTAIVVNILSPVDVRRGKKVQAEHLITIEQDGEAGYKLVIPATKALTQVELAPLEVIDGQHRLWAFDEADGGEPVPDDFELPVVAFNGLDVAWQAYLFWSINVSPKRINPSHAFDLYPLLRTQDWLERVGELNIYREARAQELTELLHVVSFSPWHNRINMLGERGTVGVSQAAWVRSLLASFFSTGKGSGRFGLFQSNLAVDQEPLAWTRGQQAAFLICIWKEIEDSIVKGAAHLWIREYDGDRRRAFTDRTSMLNQDMGVRAVLSVCNDIFYQNAEIWHLDRWYGTSRAGVPTDEKDVYENFTAIDQCPFRAHISSLAKSIAEFDWRSLDGPKVENDKELQVKKRSYRGSGGYSSLREDVLISIAQNDDTVGRASREILARAS